MEFQKSQLQAIQHGTGPAMGLAGPGSGKTLVITHRIQHLIEQKHVRPGEILVITFTRAAAGEMSARFQKLAGMQSQVTFGTFHSVFFYILKLAYHYNASNIAGEEQCRKFLCEAVKMLELDVPDEGEFVSGILEEISSIKNDRLNLEHYYSKNCSEEIFMKLYREYENRLRRENLVDFDDMLSMTLELLEQRQDILAVWQKKFKYILIDEFQDINRVQYEVIRLLAKPENNLFIVGDDDQSIYRFRGARPEIMLGFEQDYPGAARYLLDVNFRCSGEIVAAAGRLISQNRSRFDKDIRTLNRQGAPVSVREFKDAQEEASWILNRSAEYIRQGIPPEEIAVLYRTSNVPRQLVSRLIETNRPFQMREVFPNLFEHWIAKDIISYIRMSRGDRQRSTFLKIMNRPNRYLSRELLANSELTDFELLKELLGEKDWMVQRIEDLERQLSLMGRMAPFAAVNYIRKGIGYEDYIREYAAYRRMKPEELMEVLDALQESARECGTAEEWFRYMENYGEELRKQAADKQKQREGIVLSTMHAAKGLEYAVVFIMDADEKIAPHSKAVLEADVEEERRLFYVAVTRAKQKLHICWVKKCYGKEMEPSRFIDEIMN